MTTPAAHAMRPYLGELRQLFDSASASASIPPIRASRGLYRLCALCLGESWKNSHGLKCSQLVTHGYCLFDKRTRSLAHYRSRAAWAPGLFRV